MDITIKLLYTGELIPFTVPEKVVNKIYRECISELEGISPLDKDVKKIIKHRDPSSLLKYAIVCDWLSQCCLSCPLSEVIPGLPQAVIDGEVCENHFINESFTFSDLATASPEYAAEDVRIVLDWLVLMASEGSCD